MNKFSLLRLPALAICIAAASSVFAVGNQLTYAPTASSVLDQPVGFSGTPAVLNPSGNQHSDDAPSSLVQAADLPVVTVAEPRNLAELRRAVAEEQEALRQLSRSELEQRASRGQRSAQVALAEDYAREASLLGFAPAAANDALSDALGYYNLAASRGFPGAPSLDMAGVKVYPIRAQR